MHSVIMYLERREDSKVPREYMMPIEDSKGCYSIHIYICVLNVQVFKGRLQQWDKYWPHLMEARFHE